MTTSIENYPLELLRAHAACLLSVGFSREQLLQRVPDLPSELLESNELGVDCASPLDRAGDIFVQLKSLSHDESYGFAEQDSLNAGLTRLLWLSSLHQSSLGELLKSQYELAGDFGSNFGFILRNDDSGACYGFRRGEYPKGVHPNMLGRSDLNHLYWWYRVACWFVAEKVPVERVCLMASRDAYGPFAELLFGDVIHYEAEEYTVLFSSASLSLPVRRDNQSVASLERSFGGACADVNLPEQRSTRGLIEALLEEDITLMMEAAAERLHCSRHTVVRRLKEEGCSFQQIKNELRMRRARAILVDSAISIEEISDQLGFSNPPAFTRAFKQYFGLSPSQFRAQEG